MKTPKRPKRHKTGPAPALEDLLLLLRRHRVQRYSVGDLTVELSPLAFVPRKPAAGEPPATAASAVAEAFPDEDPDLFLSSGRA